MVSQVNYAFAMNDRMEPLSPFLKPGTPFLWSLFLQEKFVLAKQMIFKAAWENISKSWVMFLPTPEMVQIQGTAYKML